MPRHLLLRWGLRRGLRAEALPGVAGHRRVVPAALPAAAPIPGTATPGGAGSRSCSCTNLEWASSNSCWRSASLSATDSTSLAYSQRKVWCFAADLERRVEFPVGACNDVQAVKIKRLWGTF